MLGVVDLVLVVTWLVVIVLFTFGSVAFDVFLCFNIVSLFDVTNCVAVTGYCLFVLVYCLLNYLVVLVWLMWFGVRIIGLFIMLGWC